MEKSSGQIQSVNKAFQLLDVMSKAERPMSLQELSQSLGWAKSSVHRLLSTLREGHVVEQSQYDGRYCLGSRLFELGCAASNGWDILRMARPYLERIASATGESVCLSTIVDGEVLVLDFVNSINPWHIVSRPGARLPAHSTVQGKLMLAQKSKSEVLHILRERGMTRYTPNTICDPQEMLKELETIRRQGYAVEKAEYRVGLFSIAAPIRDETGEVRYTIAVVSMFGTPAGPKFQEVLDLLHVVTADISRTLGYEEYKTET